MLDFLFPKLLRRLCIMSQSMDRLVAEVTETRTAVDSITALVAGMAERLRDAAGDEAKVNALADELDAAQADIAEAVTANTPAAPVDEPPAEEPTP